VRRRLQLCLILSASACGPEQPDVEHEDGSSETATTAEPGSTDTDTTAETETQGDTETDSETETETETGEDCTPGEPSCDCLPDETCVDSSWALECVDGRCSECGFAHTVVSPPCSPDDCPTDCLIDLEEDALGHVMPIAIPYVSVNAGWSDVPYQEADCGAEDGWTWVVPGEQLTLCGNDCDAWMQPALEGTGYEIDYGCLPGP
jgi:hypothetical protein